MYIIIGSINLYNYKIGDEGVEFLKEATPYYYRLLYLDIGI